jgi:hypothetical protein
MSGTVVYIPATVRVAAVLVASGGRVPARDVRRFVLDALPAERAEAAKPMYDAFRALKRDGLAERIGADLVATDLPRLMEWLSGRMVRYARPALPVVPERTEQ